MKIFKSFIIPLLLFALLLPLSSCMHMMMGGHNKHDDHQSMMITKELSNGDNTLSVSVFPMTVGDEGMITLNLHSKSSVPESVSVHYMISESAITGNQSSHNHGDKSEPSGEFKMIHENIVMNNGTAVVIFKPTEAGEFIFMAGIEKQSNVDASFSIEIKFTVGEKHSMGMGSMWDYPVIGIFVMGGMMVTMWIIRGGL